MRPSDSLENKTPSDKYWRVQHVSNMYAACIQDESNMYV